MDVPIKHIIGTIALIGLVIAASLAYATITSYIETDVRRQQLKQIAEHVALNLVEIVNLVNFENLFVDENVTKSLSLPLDLGGHAYLIHLVDETDQSGGYYVDAYLLTRGDISAQSPIPLTTNQSHLVISCSETVYGGTANIVVWGRKYVNEDREIITEAGIAGGS